MSTAVDQRFWLQLPCRPNQTPAARREASQTAQGQAEDERTLSSDWRWDIFILFLFFVGLGSMYDISLYFISDTIWNNTNNIKFDMSAYEKTNL